MKPNDYQNAILDYFKILGCKIPEDQAIGKTIAAVINKSPNTVYRKMRGEIGLHLEEYISIAKHFNIELNILDPEKRTTRFSNMINLESSENQLEFMRYLQHWLIQESQLKGRRSVVAFLPELPFHHFLKYPSLCSYLRTYWFNKGIFQFSNSGESISSLSPEIQFAFESAFRSFENVACKEFISFESIHRTLVKIEAGFKATWYSRSECLSMLQQLLNLVNEYEYCTAKGYRRSGEKLDVYLTESHYSNALIQLNISGKPFSTLTNTGNAMFMETQSLAYNESMSRHIDSIVSTSTLISKSSQRIRNELFNHYRAEIDSKIEAIYPTS